MSTETSYRKALRYMYSLTDYENRGFAAYAPEFYNLDRMRRFLALLGSPQQEFRSVHVAGTKGKGSTAAMVESILRASGYRTGLYTSPHLHTFRERIQAGGTIIPEADVVRLVSDLRSLVNEEPNITTFELMTSLAFAWFVEQGVDWLVAEVGLGGRLDATNVLLPEVTVITSISHDHTAVLGETLAEIATEKAGIVKPGVPLVSAPQRDEALAVIESVADRQGARLTLVGRDCTWERHPDAGDVAGQSFTVQRGADVWPELWIPLLGAYQVVNAATAMATVAALGDVGCEVPDAAVRAGLRQVQWPGRLEILSRDPYVVADSAHNGDSAKKLVVALRAHLGFERLIVIWGASSDHVTSELMVALLSEASRAIATRTRHPRAADPVWLQSRAAELGFEVDVTDNVSQALDLALDSAGPGDLVCCAGSVFVAAEVRAACFSRQGLPQPPSDPA